MAVLVGKPAPDFTVPAVLADGRIDEAFNLAETLAGKYGLLFFYPLDFTFVCPSELIALEHRIDAFRERDVEVIGISIDSHFSHNAWRRTPVEQGGIGPVRFTLAADITREITRAYDVQAEGGMALRAAFIIDRDGVVRSQLINDLPVGRNIDELLRLVDALQFHERRGEVCPAGWQQGEAGMTPSPQGAVDYLKKNAGKL
ncbi:peroxiredoxin [Alcanivorax quisquiliarum]|uniref:Thioredoxin peroxidase n=1 Tax=Alcanivorax quisquiliarum TaxID=2933565 RepID=A0ABT0E8X9_9GAMM|nr:peroxiredoxin [Alcanivorax quisquiliarum]MCK0538286.1 peroxiredoxin [Alcanivorax quisquiliarum]